MVPAQPALDDFVKQYFLHVHPSTPVLDEASFWHMYLECGNTFVSGGQKLSVFVFQAMLFTSCSVSILSYHPGPYTHGSSTSQMKVSDNVASVTSESRETRSTTEPRFEMPALLPNQQT